MRTISFARCTAMILGVMVWSLPGSVRAENSGAVVYHRISEGEEVEGAAKRVLIQQDGLSRLYEVPTGTPIAMAPQELSYFDFGARRTIQTAKLPDGSRCTVMTALDSLPPLAMTDERETILGHECIKATTEIRSNKIEVWLIRDVGITGSPTTSVAAEGGLILKLVQNGSSGLLAGADRDGSAGGRAASLGTAAAVPPCGLGRGGRFRRVSRPDHRQLCHHHHGLRRSPAQLRQRDPQPRRVRLRRGVPLLERNSRGAARHASGSRR
ncbi:MAG: hypothetical protein R3E12_00395 [Candidatus Eisenbacteria bacterium]